MDFDSLFFIGNILKFFLKFWDLLRNSFKLGFLALLSGYHFSLQWMYGKLQKEDYPMTSMQLRFYNEAATILLFAIVFTATFKNTMSGLYGILGIVGLGVLLSFGIMLYKKFRKD